jgi:hypothetical protein
MSERRAARLALTAGLLGTLAACHSADAQRMRSTTSARQLQGETRANVQLTYGAGRLRVSPARGDLLYRMELRYDDEQFRPVTEYDRAGGKLKLGVESREHRGRHHGSNNQHATIELTPRLPLELSLAFGAGEADVELGGLALQDVHLQTGASRTNISFASPNRVAARRVKVDAGGMVKRGNAWYSRNYDQAQYKLDVSIHAAVGSVEVDWID